jgi:hypothetical protein
VAYDTRLWQSIDFKAVTQYHDDKLTMFNDEWKVKFAESDTGGKWSPLYIILGLLIHSSSKLDRNLIRIQMFSASFVRVRLTTGILEKLTLFPLSFKPRKLLKTRDALVRVSMRL